MTVDRLRRLSLALLAAARIVHRASCGAVKVEPKACQLCIRHKSAASSLVEFFTGEAVFAVTEAGRRQCGGEHADALIDMATAPDCGKRSPTTASIVGQKKGFADGVDAKGRS
ncbi:MAG: hypothetical protein R3F13_02245 [Prosthecobacter sp.]